MPDPDAKAEEQPTEREPDEDAPASEDEQLPPEEVVSEARRRGLGSLLGLIDSSARRGQDIVTEVAKGSKEELVRVISAEVRGFLDKMDIVDLAQEIVSGLKVEAHVEIKFSRDADGRVQPEVTKSDTKLASKGDESASDDGAPRPKKTGKNEKNEKNEKNGNGRGRRDT